MTEPRGAKEVSREEARAQLAEGAQIVDVRAPHEWEAGHVAGALHIPLQDLPERTGELDRERPVIVYCRGGNRSTMAAEALAGGGFEAAKLSEGIVGWAGEGLELEPPDGEVADSGKAAAIIQSRRQES